MWEAFCIQTPSRAKREATLRAVITAPRAQLLCLNFAVSSNTEFPLSQAVSVHSSGTTNSGYSFPYYACASVPDHKLPADVATSRHCRQRPFQNGERGRRGSASSLATRI